MKFKNWITLGKRLVAYLRGQKDRVIYQSWVIEDEPPEQVYEQILTFIEARARFLPRLEDEEVQVAVACAWLDKRTDKLELTLRPDNPQAYQPIADYLKSWSPPPAMVAVELMSLGLLARGE